MTPSNSEIIPVKRVVELFLKTAHLNPPTSHIKSVGYGAVD
jgi:hypothetical protein